LEKKSTLDRTLTTPNVALLLLLWERPYYWKSVVLCLDLGIQCVYKFLLVTCDQLVKQWGKYDLNKSEVILKSINLSLLVYVGNAGFFLLLLWERLYYRKSVVFMSGPK